MRPEYIHKARRRLLRIDAVAPFLRFYARHLDGRPSRREIHDDLLSRDGKLAQDQANHSNMLKVISR
jgi:hypothetical protein